MHIYKNASVSQYFAHGDVYNFILCINLKKATSLFPTFYAK